MPRGRPGQGGTQKYSRFPTGDPRFQKLTNRGGGAVVPVPFVITVAINAISSTSANVVGSINPNGYDTTWWISYGTVLPLPSGVTTGPIDIGSGTNPVTVTTTLVGLAASTTYYVAVVGQNAGGTSYGQTLSFTTTATVVPVVSPSFPVVPFGQTSVTIPHFAMPFTVLFKNQTAQGVLVAEQDTLEEITANVDVIVSCPVGACAQLPAFGRPDLTFAQGPVDTNELTAAIQRWEPRATENAVSSLLSDGTTWGITLTTSTTVAENI